MILVYLILFSYIIKIAGYFILLLNSRKHTKKPDEASDMSVDIILPMYNEEEVIIKTINNLLNIKYNKFSIIVVDDGSTDRSLSVVEGCFKDHAKVKVFSQKNNGKWFALNSGISASKSDIVFCIDADTMVKPDVIDKILPYFFDERVAAVSGYLKVGNRNNILTNIQYVEYITNENFEREIFDSVNGIMTIPGAVGAFRRSSIMTVGGYAGDVLTEDCDLTLKLLCRNYKIRNAPDAIGYTEAPANLKMFFRQRVRWKVGTVQVLLKYQKQLFSNPNKILCYIVIPYKWFFGVFLPLITPFADYLFLYDLLISHQYSILPYYLSLIFIDTLICIVAMMHIKEHLALFFFIPFQRFLFRSLSLFSYLHICIKFFHGNLFQWNKVTRYGSVKLD